LALIKRTRELKQVTISILILFLTLSAYSQVNNSDDLYKTIHENDSLLFDIGFNTCNIQILQDLIGQEFSFYHDQSGITNSKEAFIESVQNGLCKLPYKAIRVLNKGSSSIYPLKSNDTIYGAVQNGEHSFYALEENNQKYLTSTAKFTHVWIIENGTWKLRSVLSYNHEDIDKINNGNGLFTDNEVTNNWLKQKNIPAVGIGFIDKGQIVQLSVFGELEQDQPAPLNTIWNVASMTKPITAVITLTLANQGFWNLDEPVYKYYTDPDVANDPNSKLLTTRMILSHQSGFPNWRGNSSEGKLKFEFEPGTKYQYSGEGYEYLRKALEAKFHKSLEQLAQELVFNPLEMNNTQLVWSESMEIKPFAKWHNSEYKLYETDKYYKVNAADNLLTTVEDYSKFMLYILQGAGVSDSLKKDMIANQVRVSSFKHFGLGWWVDEKINANDDYALVLAGDDIGVHCIAFILPNSEKGLLIFTNSDNGTDAYMEIIEQYLENDAEGIIRAEMNK
jgi:CubicO group peptidase (beta-lactamase class C family)